jgi:hypothetical protein
MQFLSNVNIKKKLSSYYDKADLEANLYLEDAKKKSSVAKSKRFCDDARKLVKQKDGIDTFFGSVHIKDITTGMMRKYIDYLN